MLFEHSDYREMLFFAQDPPYRQAKEAGIDIKPSIDGVVGTTYPDFDRFLAEISNGRYT